MRSLFFVFLYLLIVSFSYASKNDSLLLVLEKEIPDSTRINVLKELLYLNSTTDPSQSILYGMEGLALARKIKDIKSEINLANNLGIAFYGIGDYDKTLEYFHLVLRKEKELGNDLADQSRAMNNLGIIYKDIGLLDKSANYFEQSIAIKEKLADSIGISNTMSNLGLVYLKRTMPEKAINCFRQCLIIDTKMNNNAGIYNSLANIGLYHKDYGSPDSAINYLLKAFSTIPAKEQNYDRADLLKSLAQAYLKKQDYKRARMHFSQSIQLSKKMEAIEILKENYRGLAELYEKNQQYEQALEAFKLFKTLNDSIFSEDFKKQVATIEKNFELKEREKEILLLKQNADITNLQLSRRKNTNYFLYALGLLLAVTAGITYNRYKIKNKANKLLEIKNLEITEQKSEIKEQKDEIETQRDNIYSQKKALEEAGQEIIESIVYAQNIQKAILPDLAQIRKSFNDLFVIYLPKSIVSGDFYWYAKKKNKVFFAVADCTGHGIPGAFMTVMANDLLNNIIIHKDMNNCAEILHTLDEAVLNSLQYKENSVTDGLEIAIICWDINSGQLTFSGANMDMLLIKEGHIQEIKGERFSMGGFAEDRKKTAKNHEFSIQQSDQLYLYTDGFADQFGSTEDKKFLKKQFKNTIASIHSLPMEQQKSKLEEALANWKGDTEQTDDITVAGIRF